MGVPPSDVIWLLARRDVVRALSYSAVRREVHEGERGALEVDVFGLTANVIWSFADCLEQV